VLGDRDPTLDDVARFAVRYGGLAETLRLYPPAPAFGRRPIADVTLGGYLISAWFERLFKPVRHAAQRALVSPIPMNSGPKRWATAPLKFAYFPFGGGAKMCIGEPFSKLEGVLILATLARRLQLNLIGDAAIGIAPGATMRPDRAIIMRPALRADAQSARPV